MYPASCVETNLIVGRHPSDAATYGYKMGFTFAVIVGNHWVNRSFERWRDLYIPWTASLVAANIYAAHHNIGVINNLEAARNRLMNEVPIQQSSFAEIRELSSDGFRPNVTTGFPRWTFSRASIYKMQGTVLMAASPPNPFANSAQPASAQGWSLTPELGFTQNKTSYRIASFAPIQATVHTSRFGLPTPRDDFLLPGAWPPVMQGPQKREKRLGQE